MTYQMQKIPFHGDTLTVIEQDGEPYVAVKPICERLGIAWSPQYRKLTGPENDWNCCLMTIVGGAADGKNREMLCLALIDLPLWLASISPSRLGEEHREAFMVYRRECKKVLWEHFMGERRELELWHDRATWLLLASNPFYAKIYSLCMGRARYSHLKAHFPSKSWDMIYRAVREMTECGILLPGDWSRPGDFIADGPVPPETSRAEARDRSWPPKTDWRIDASFAATREARMQETPLSEGMAETATPVSESSSGGDA